MTAFSMFNVRAQAVQEDGTLSNPFFRFLNNLFQSAGGSGPVSTISVGKSPFTYTASQTGQAIIQGGTVSKVQFSRDGGTTLIDTGSIGGLFYLKGQDLLVVTYSAAPTMTWVPS